jgi:Polyketide cyclase / dehydrase and lipid transport
MKALVHAQGSHMMIKKFLFFVLAALVAFSGYVAMQPPQYRVERSAVMAASPAAIFDQVNDLKKWEAWSPWAKKDPNAQSTFEGPSAGKDAVMGWSGNDDVGEGRMTIVESKPAEAIRLKLDFVKPFEGTSDVNFAFTPAGDKTKVTWSISGEQSFIERAICLLMGVNMDSMIGGDYEKGLANLKEQVRG